MKSYREELWFETKTRRAYLNITRHVEAAIKKSGIQEGLVLVNAMHITASVYINDDEPGLLKDYDEFLEAARSLKKRSIGTTRRAKTTAMPIMKRQLMGREVVVAITEGRLDFGPWEQIFYGEFDGNSRKRVLVKVIGCVSRMLSSQRSKLCGNKMFERLLPREKFGNMDHDFGWCDRSVSIC